MLKSTPPMGWNSWNTFGENISDRLIRETADIMADEGYLDAGYDYLVIDDCWSLRQRDENGRLVADPAKFPNGMKDLADYVHSKGLKFGMYSCAGVRTCAGYPGSYGHEFEDARTFAEWGVDFLKYDYCFKPWEATGEVLYRRMGLALRASGRDILFSACNWGSDDSGRWMRSAGAHMYRSTGDIVDSYQSFTDIAASQADKLGFGAPNCFNDLDMLIVGMYGKGNVGVAGCTDAEYRSHFAQWCFFNSPLMIGCDLRNVNTESAQLLKNKELIAINQDPEVRPPYKFGNAYFKHLADGSYVLGVFNPYESESRQYLLFADAGLPVNCGYGFRLRDIFTGEDCGVYTGDFFVDIPARDCKVYRVTVERVK